MEITRFCITQGDLTSLDVNSDESFVRVTDTYSRSNYCTKGGFEHALQLHRFCTYSLVVLSFVVVYNDEDSTVPSVSPSFDPSVFFKDFEDFCR